MEFCCGNGSNSILAIYIALSSLGLQYTSSKIIYANVCCINQFIASLICLIAMFAVGVFRSFDA